MMGMTGLLVAVTRINDEDSSVHWTHFSLVHPARSYIGCVFEFLHGMRMADEEEITVSGKSVKGTFI